MTEPKHDTSIAALLARPSELMSGGEVYEVKKALLNAVSLLGEVEVYQEAGRLGTRDPRAAHALLIEQGADPDWDPAFPWIRIGLIGWLNGAIKAETEAAGETRDLLAEVNEDLPGGPADRAREAAFRAQPSRFLPGATRSAVVLFRSPGFGMIQLDGVDMPWTYAALSKGRSDFAELYAVVEDGGYAGGVLVGPPGIEQEIDLPDGYRFVAVDLSTGGRA